MSLDSRDAYVLSRIDGVMLAHEIVDVCGLDPWTATEILNRLTAMGLIHWDHEVPVDSTAASEEPGRRLSGTRMSTKRNLASMRAPAPRLLERFERLTHYQLLGLYADCSPADSSSTEHESNNKHQFSTDDETVFVVE